MARTAPALFVAFAARLQLLNRGKAEKAGELSGVRDQSSADENELSRLAQRDESFYWTWQYWPR